MKILNKNGNALLKCLARMSKTTNSNVIRVKQIDLAKKMNVTLMTVVNQLNNMKELGYIRMSGIRGNDGGTEITLLDNNERQKTIIEEKQVPKANEQLEEENVILSQKCCLSDKVAEEQLINSIKAYKSKYGINDFVIYMREWYAWHRSIKEKTNKPIPQEEYAQLAELRINLIRETNPKMIFHHIVYLQDWFKRMDIYNDAFKLKYEIEQFIKQEKFFNPSVFDSFLKN